MVKTLNGIRTLLFLFIFGAHFKYVILYSELGRNLFHFFDIGRFAILCFFLLSGFCIALGYSDKFKNISKQSYLNFVIKRFVRIYPLYLLTGIVGLLFIFLPQGIKWLHLFLFVYVPMLTPWLGINAGGNVAGWFVCAIFFCYLIAPIFLVWFNQNNNLKFHIIFSFVNYLILTVFSIYLMLINVPNNEFFFRFPVIRLFEYFVALDVGFIFVKFLKGKLDFKIFNNYFYKSLIDVLYAAVFILIMYVLPNNLLYRHVIAIPVVCSFFVYMCIEKRSFLYDIFTSKLFDFGGNISYECYMIHLLLFNFMTEFSKKYLSALTDIVFLYLILLLLTVIISIVYNQTVMLIKKYVIKS